MSLKPSHLNAPGQAYHDFEVTKAIEIPELHCFLRELVHLPTGARVMHISNDDPENLFCLSFRTIPENSNGVAHILEHTVLCGSEKYPVKDPFFAMTRRSLNTFMNALTGSDFTCYPAASQVPKDFYNLLEVYLDAVFHPNLNQLSFLQEGHRLEFSNPEDPDSPLEYKGIVFNEMKGSLASPTARLAEAMNAALFPDLTYGYNSGGDPKNIPELTYQELCAFYQQFYQPSRCLFFFYGNMPLEGHLDFIAKHALEQAKKTPPVGSIPLQPRFLAPKHLEMHYPVSPDEELEDKGYIAFGWLTCNILDHETVLALSALELILMDTDASPLKLAFLKSGLCKQANIYSDSEISEVPVVIILKGCDAKDADKLEEVLRNTLKEIIHNGIPLQMVENVMHQLEFFRSEIGGNHSPFGLSLFMRSALIKQHGGDAEHGLTIHALFDELHRRNLEDPKYLVGLLQKYFLDNPHFVRIVMEPDPDLATKEISDEKEVLEKIRRQLAPGEVKQIIRHAAELSAFQKQQAEEDIDILPKIGLEDVPKASRRFNLIHEMAGNVEVFHHNTFTNKIVYADLNFDLPDFTMEELPLVRLLSVLMTQMGSGGRNYVDTLEYIQANTGGLSAFPSLFLQASDCYQYTPVFSIRGKALYRKAHKLFPLLTDTATAVDLSDRERLKEIVLKHYTSLQTSLIHSAMKYATSLAASALDHASAISNQWYGLGYYQAIHDIVGQLDSHFDQLCDKLKDLQLRLKALQQPHLVLTCDSVMYDELKQQKFYGLQEIQTGPRIPWKGNVTRSNVSAQGRVISSPVAFTGRVFKTIPYIHPDSPALSIASALFDNITLHPLVREQGGAYGGGAVNNALGGNFSFYAYRDPNIATTLSAFSKAVDNVIAGEFDDSDMEEAKLEIIQSLDAPVAPGSRGDIAYSWTREGRSPEVRQSFRNRLLSLERDDVIEAVRTHLKPQIVSGTTVIFAGKELLEKENSVLEAAGMAPLQIESI